MPDTPLAYLITFRCYGTWLHGDERGSVDRHRNVYGRPCVGENPRWRSYNARALKRAPVQLNAAQRKTVEYAIKESCLFRNWDLHAVNARTNHVHSVVTAYLAPKSVSVPFAVANGFAEALPPERILNAFKANATRQMREDGHWRDPHTPWADGGSRRYIWTEFGLERAKEYVLNGQSGPIPDFDRKE